MQHQNLYDSIAFLRAVSNKDWDGAELIFNEVDHPLEIIMPTAELFAALVRDLALATELEEENIWQQLADMKYVSEE